MPKIRHLAMVCMDPEKLAKFYCEVFEMKEVARSERGGRTNVFLTDGYMNLGAAQPEGRGQAQRAQSLRFPCRGCRRDRRSPEGMGRGRPDRSAADRVYAEQRATDPEGNNYDIAEGGFDRDLATPKKTKAPVTA